MNPLLALIPLLAVPSQVPDTQITIDTNRLGTKVSKDLYGIFFEEINHAGDGGLYGELLQNRGFEEGTNGEPAPSWQPISGSAILDAQTPFNEVKLRSLRLDGTVRNQGFTSISLVRGTKYRLTLWVRGENPIEAALGSPGQPPVDWQTSKNTGAGWHRNSFTFAPKATNKDGALWLRSASGKPVSIGFASLVPEKTWKNRSLRNDLASHVEKMKPAFVRFPGGCFVEGQYLGQAFDWKGSLGPIELRKGITKGMWGYSSTDGLGYHEYLQWCEDLRAAPLFVANCGISHTEVTPLAEMNKWVESVLDAIEYANGPVTSVWGAKRAAAGHPMPFGLKYIEIGNENGASWSYGGPKAYAERYPILFRAIKAKYPEMICIADNPVPHPMEVIDEHYYSNPDWFWANANRYDSYDRKGPKIYVGEYAVTEGCGLGNLRAALSEAAFIVGMERNSDVVTMSSYAPLLVNVNGKQWNPDAIVFNSHSSYGTPSYHVQALFGNNRPDRILPVRCQSPAEPYQLGGGVGLSTWKTEAEFKDIELVVDGKVVAAKNWTFNGQDWREVNGGLMQSSLQENRLAFAQGNPLDGSQSFVYRLKARKISGAEGFIIPFQTGTHGHNLQWNLGGWGNVKHAFQAGGSRIVGREVPGKIETGRWYEIRIEGQGSHFRAFLDNELVQEYTDRATPTFAVGAGIKGDDVVLKVVNGGERSRLCKVNLTSGPWESVASGTILSSQNLDDENTFERPKKVSPRKTQVQGISESFPLQVPARSLMILHLKRARP